MLSTKPNPEPLSRVSTPSLEAMEKQILHDKDLLEKNRDYLKMIREEINKRVINIL